MSNFLTYMYLLTPLHTGGSADEGNLMGIAREVHTEFPYLPSSSLRGRIRAAMEKGAIESDEKENVGQFFGQKIKEGNQPTEGEVWFADATLLFFPIASLSHHLVWVTCPLWLERWSRWLSEPAGVTKLISTCRNHLNNQATSAVLSFNCNQLYLQTAVLSSAEIEKFDPASIQVPLQLVAQKAGLVEHLLNKLVVLTDEDCIALVETGLQREVRVALDEGSKTVKGGSFRSEEAIPPETMLFFPWGTKPPKKLRPDAEDSDQQMQEKVNKKSKSDRAVRQNLGVLLHDQRLQFGGLEGLGRGWTELTTPALKEAS